MIVDELAMQRALADRPLAPAVIDGTIMESPSMSEFDWRKSAEGIYDSRRCQPQQLFPPQPFSPITEPPCSPPVRNGWVSVGPTSVIGDHTRLALMPSSPPEPISLPGMEHCSRSFVNPRPQRERPVVSAHPGSVRRSEVEALKRPPLVPLLRLDLIQSGTKYLRTDLSADRDAEADDVADMGTGMEAEIGFVMPDGRFQCVCFEGRSP